MVSYKGEERTKIYYWKKIKYVHVVYMFPPTLACSSINTSETLIYEIPGMEESGL